MEIIYLLINRYKVLDLIPKTDELIVYIKKERKMSSWFFKFKNYLGVLGCVSFFLFGWKHLSFVMSLSGQSDMAKVWARKLIETWMFRNSRKPDTPRKEERADENKNCSRICGIIKINQTTCQLELCIGGARIKTQNMPFLSQKLA